MTPDERWVKKTLDEEWADESEGTILKVTGWPGDSKWRYSLFNGWELLPRIQNISDPEGRV